MAAGFIGSLKNARSCDGDHITKSRARLTSVSKPTVLGRRCGGQGIGCTMTSKKSSAGATERPRNELSAGLAACRNAIIAIGLASTLINVLYLSGSIYMLEVYDRVLPSRS